MSSNENRQKYKDEMQATIRETLDEITDSHRLYLEGLAKQLNLTTQEMVEVEDEIRIPLRKYENFLIDKIKQDYPKLKEESVIALQVLQKELNLADVDIAMIVKRMMQMNESGEFADAPVVSLAAAGMGISVSSLLVLVLAPPLAPLVNLAGVATIIRGFYNGWTHGYKRRDVFDSLAKIVNNKNEELTSESKNEYSENQPLTSDLNSEIILELTEEEMSKGTDKIIFTGLENITVKIPAGVTSGKRIRIKDKGKLNKQTQKREDLYLIVKNK